MLLAWDTGTVCAERETLTCHRMSRWLRTAADRAKRATCLVARREQAKERVRRKQAKGLLTLLRVVSRHIRRIRRKRIERHHFFHAATMTTARKVRVQKRINNLNVGISINKTP